MFCDQKESTPFIKLSIKISSHVREAFLYTFIYDYRIEKNIDVIHFDRVILIGHYCNIFFL